VLRGPVEPGAMMVLGDGFDDPDRSMRRRSPATIARPSRRRAGARVGGVREPSTLHTNDPPPQVAPGAAAPGANFQHGPSSRLRTTAGGSGLPSR